MRHCARWEDNSSRTINAKKKKNALYHAEILAIDKACHALGGWRLPGCTLYVTLEPCPMCAGAIVSARIERVVYGAKDPKAGAFGSVLNINSYPLNHKPEIISGVLKRDCADMLSQIFAKKEGELFVNYMPYGIVIE